MKNIVTTFLQIQDQLKIYHWQTKSYAEHKAFGKTYGAIEESVDEFVETLMGKRGRFQLEGEDVIELENISDESVMAFVDDTVEFLVSLNKFLDPIQDTDLLNIRDSMLGSFNTLKYLLTLQ